MSNIRVLLVASLLLVVGGAYAHQPILHILNSSTQGFTVSLDSPDGEIHTVALDPGECLAVSRPAGEHTQFELDYLLPGQESQSLEGASFILNLADEGASSCMVTADVKHPLVLRGVEAESIQGLMLSGTGKEALKLRFSMETLSEGILLSQNS